MARVGVSIIVVISVVIHAGSVRSQISPSVFYSQLTPVLEQRSHHDTWIHSGKFQGDIDVDPSMFEQPDEGVFYNALKNRQLIWPDGAIPFELDTAFSQAELGRIERAFASYERSTCIRFVRRSDQEDFLYIKKGSGCYSQVGRVGGRQELSLGNGCLFHDIIVHELMHSVGFWHEHSRADRDDHINIRWENILPGMKEQFNKISAVLQDTLGENYDYESIMHYESAAFSRNGQNTIEAVVPDFTQIIGTVRDLSTTDIVKINKLYRCSSQIGRQQATPTATPTTTTAATTTTQHSPDVLIDVNSAACRDHFPDCPHFKGHCHKASFFFVMKSYCPLTCKHCSPKDD
ncbi:hypothetical protein L596_005526 [Steinernema carpocapsae]|uniref:Metalloendopeptidase n=1 Tax=Steinernema carpocapsae TaxID=34508 RepID=A0A4U8UZJ2_STECR|nr:hypothetical protein L596_005526 [Steinernema carpocapsae]